MIKKPRKKKEINDTICPLCKQFMDVRCIGHSQDPFIDGKKYEAICHTCWAVPKIWYYINDSFDGPYFDGSHLHTPEELVQDGFDIIEIKISIKAIKESIKKNKSKNLL